MMKRCPKCCEVLPLDAFRKRPKCDRPRAYCKECQRAYHAQYYQENVRQYSEHRRRNSARYRKRNRENLLIYLFTHPCVDCGESDPRVLEFDHLGEKTEDVASLASSAVSWRRVEEEIAKCVVRCANCHRRKTVVDLGWYKGMVGGA